jgi:hypothetical protein
VCDDRRDGRPDNHNPNRNRDGRAEISDIVSSFTFMILHSVRFVAVFRGCLPTQSLEHGSLYNIASASAASSGEPQSISSMATVPSRKQAMIARPA